MNISESQNRRRSAPSMLIVLDVLLLLMILATAVHTIIVSRMRVLGPATQAQSEFWQQRANELCVGRKQIPAAPTLRLNADPLEQLAFLAELMPYSQKVWELYQGCQEPITREITEDLLHFKVNRFNEFEADTDVQAAFKTIRTYVDESLLTRRNQIYVMGHTDDTADDKYNYDLSYQRALYIAEGIQKYLAASGKQAGRDYAIYPVGMGKSQLKEQQSREPQDKWRTRCRRIELSFRSLRGGGQARRPS